MKRIQSINPILLALVWGLTACSPKVNTGGYVKDGELKDQIVEGKTSKDEVLAKFGSPSSQSSFGNETWYYITDRKEAYGPFKPSVVQQDVVCIEFDSGGLVSKVETYNRDDGRNVRLASRTTPTEGHTLSFFEQILGNIGRFNSPSNGKPGGGSGATPGGSGY